MKQTLRHIIRGCGTLPHCGDHPGTAFLYCFAAMGAIAGAKGGLIAAIAGAGVMLIFFGPVYLLGVCGRSVDDERYAAREDQSAPTDPSK